MAKRDQLDAEALLRKNPHIDRKAFAESQRKVAEALKLVGSPRRRHDLAVPYGGRRIVIDDASKPRTRSQTRITAGHDKEISK